MAKLKFYLRTKGNIEEQTNAYIDVFKGKLLKKSFLHPSLEVDGNEGTLTYTYFSLLGNINMMMARWYKSHPNIGYAGDIVLRVDSEKEFDEIQNNLENSQYFKLDYPKTAYAYADGIYLTKYYDQWGFGWILEIPIENQAI